MAKVTMLMPRMGESVMEATILQWLKKEGDAVREEESIVEVATDKVDSEVPTPYAGRLQKVLVQAGEIVKIGAPIAIIAAEGEVDATSEEVLSVSTTFPEVAPLRSAQSSPQSVPALQVPKSSGGSSRFYSPLVRHIAQQAGISIEILRQIPGTGKGNRVTKHDVLTYLQHVHKLPKDTHSTAQEISSTYITPEDEVIQLDRVRQLIAKRMVASKHIAPHVTSFVEADVTSLVQWYHTQKEHFVQKTAVQLKYTPLFVQAIVKALLDFPRLNAFVESNRLIKKKDIHVGLAVALSDGNLVVPVIKHANQLSLVELARQVYDLVHRARQQQLVPDELTGATYTISNLGSFRNLMGTPIIAQPQVAILALGAIVKKPAVIEVEGNDTIAIRHKMYLSHAYDHRVIDGAIGGSFVRRVADYLESFLDWVHW